MLAPSYGRTVSLAMPRDSAWRFVVGGLARSFFVVNNLDQASGLINVSYSGDPERYINCGRMNSKVSNMAGDRTYDFPAAKAHMRFEVMQGGSLYTIVRDLSLEGRVNLLLEGSGQDSSRVTVNARYVVQKQTSVVQAGASVPQSSTETISFNSGASAAFSPSGNGQATVCGPTGELEKSLLAAVQGR